MKALFLLLCLLNLVFFLWQFQAGRLDLPVAAPQYAGQILTVDEAVRARRGAEIDRMLERRIEAWQQAEVERMLADLRPPVLLSNARAPSAETVKPLELRRKEKPVLAEASSAPVPVAPVVKKCFEAGPFSDEADAKKWLAQKGLASRQILSRDMVVGSDFQVYFPAAKTNEQALANKMMLKDKGLQDIWMIPDGDKKGAFSLGVFKEKSRAIIFKTQMAARGITAEIRAREKTQTQWFAKIMLEKSSAKQYQSPAVPISTCSNN